MVMSSNWFPNTFCWCHCCNCTSQYLISGVAPSNTNTAQIPWKCKWQICQKIPITVPPHALDWSLDYALLWEIALTKYWHWLPKLCLLTFPTISIIQLVIINAIVLWYHCLNTKKCSDKYSRYVNICNSPGGWLLSCIFCLHSLLLSSLFWYHHWHHCLSIIHSVIIFVMTHLVDCYWLLPFLTSLLLCYTSFPGSRFFICYCNF